MSNTRFDTLPKARTEKLIVKQLPDETLVYDLETDQAHCLNKSAAWVWEHCDGETTVAEMAQAMADSTGRAVDESLVWLALDELERFHLLTTPTALPKELAGMNRRQWVRKIGLAAIALPMIISISAPPAHAQASCPAGPNNQPPGCPCNGNGNCTSNNCLATTPRICG